MSFSIALGNFLYKRAFVLYKPLYALFKNKQDAFEIELLKKHIKSGATVLDIGANIGYYANLLAEIVGERGRVHCFEPDTQNFVHLQKSCGSIYNVTLNNKAVSAKTEKLKIYTSKNLNVDHRTYKPEEYDAEFDIDAISIDDYVQGLQTTNGKQVKIDFIKIDIQGFEMQALKGMNETLANNMNIELISEFWPYGLRKAGSSVSEYFEHLTRLGFTCYLLDTTTLKKLDLNAVKALEPLGEAHYFNIFASRNHV